MGSLFFYDDGEMTHSSLTFSFFVIRDVDAAFGARILEILDDYCKD